MLVLSQVVQEVVPVGVVPVGVVPVGVVPVGVVPVGVVEVGVVEVIQKNLLEHQHEWLQRLCMTDNYPAYLQRRLEVVSGRSSEDR